MDNFLESEKLLIQPEFTKIASKLYAQFITMDPQYYLSMDPTSDRPFDLTVKSWEYVCKQQEPKRTIGVYTVPFIWYAGEELLKQFLYKDWTDFRKVLAQGAKNDTKNKVTAFLNELEQLKTRIESKDYLQPIVPKLTEGFKVINEFHSNASKQTEMSNKEDYKPLQWNGTAVSLGCLFHDLRTTRSLKSKKMFIDAIPKDIVQFILKNFVDANGEPFEESSFKKYLDPTANGKRAMKERFVIIKESEEDED